MKHGWILVMVLVAGVGLARSFDTGYEPDGLDELEKQKGSFKTTLIDPDTNFSGYSKIYPKKVMLVVRDPGPQDAQPPTGSLLGKSSGGGVMPEWEDLAELKRIINDAIVAELGRSTGLELVNDAGPETLVLRATVTDVVCDESSKVKTEDGEPALTVSQGTIVFDLIDGETGVIRARVGERRKCRAAKGAAPTIEGPWPNVANWAALATADFCSELARFTGSNEG
jgi:hypothetical protein